MAPAKKKSARKPAPRKRPVRKPARKGAKGAARRAAALETDHPIGMAVADGFAFQRLKAPKALKTAPKKEVREIGWATFGEIARQLATRIAKRFRPDAVVGIAKGGVFVGSAVASTLDTDFFPVRIEARRRDSDPIPEATDQLPDLKGKRVLVVDDVCRTGATLAKAKRLARKAGAKDVRTATLVVRPDGARPDFSALETSELVLFGWDYQLEQTDGQIELPADEPDATDPAESGV